MPRKIAAMLLAAAHFGAANCRFACALGTSDRSPAVAARYGHADGACRHSDKSPDGSDRRRDSPAPCCMGHLDGAPVLLPADVSLVRAPIAALSLESLAAEAPVPLVQSRACVESLGPPLVVSAILERSRRRPRAPPSRLAVL